MSIVPCTPTTPVHGVVVFEPAVFKIDYPQFATVSNSALLLNFGLATLQLSNTCGSRVCDAVQRESLLNLLVAHITTLLNGINGQPAAGIVGRISDATEGSVSVSAKWDGTASQAQAYYLQTQFGAMYWQSTARYRQMLYVGAPNCGNAGIYPGSGAGIGPVGNGYCGNNGGSS
jgi:hypothetical protein